MIKSYSDTINSMAKEHNEGLAETDAKRKERTGLSSNEMTDRESAAVQKTKFRVTLDSIRQKIVSCDYYNPPSASHMTLAIVLLDNGYIIVGKSTPADPENFNAELGRKFALEDAERQIWPLEAYLLRETLTILDEGRNVEAGS